MSKGKIVYKVFVYLFTFLIIIGGGVLYAVLQTKSATDAENASTSVYAEDIYGSSVHYIYPSQDEISLWDGVSSEAPEGMGTQNSPYLISSAANLKYFQQNYSTFNSTYLLQTVNIDLQNFEWTAITEGQYYYDGGGHTIYNLYQTSLSSNKGLFYKINNGYLKNLNVVGANLTRESTSSNFSRAAVFTTQAYGTSSSYTLLENLHATNVVISTKIASGTDTGGIVGRSEYINVKNCSFDGDIYVEANISTSTNGFSVAGIVGCNTGGMTIENCSCFGNIFTKLNNSYTAQSSYVGGIYGGAGSGVTTITSCINYANIQTKNSTGVNFTGGVVGRPDSNNNGSIGYCINYGSIYGESNSSYSAVGGICGRVDNNGAVSSCSNYGNIYSYGMASNAYAGGIGGYAAYGTYKFLFNAGNILAREASGRDVEAGGIFGQFYGESDKVVNINSSLNVGTVASYTSNINGLGGSFGYVYNNNVSVSYVYHVTDVVTNGHWETAYYMSDTSKITGLGSANLITSGDGGGTVNCTNSGGITSANAKVTSIDSAPTGLRDFSSDYWDFSQVGEYPKLKNMPTATNLKAETKQIKLVTTGASKIYDGTEQQEQAEVCTYELKGFENSDPTSYWDGITTTMPNGKGTQADPYLIESAANLAWVSANSQTSTGLALNKYYVQCVNIDLNNMFWTPINKSWVSGKIYYDGNYHTIKNLNILQTTNVYVGLFGYVNGYVKNLGIESGKIVAGTNVSNVGTICSCLYNDGEVTNCYNKAKIYASVASSAQVGGIVSNQGDNSIVKNCWNAGDIYGYAGAQYVGGIVAVNGWGGVATNCVNTAKIVLAGSNSSHVGGIVGSGGADGCINYGDITTSGDGNIKNAYIGGICGSCYFDQECVIGSNYNYGSLSGLIGYCSKAGGIVGNYDSDGESSMAVYSYYNSQVAGFNITAGCALKDFTLTNTMNFTTIELVVTAENTKPTGVAASSNFNYFKGSFPSVKSKIGNMTFYQKVIDENASKPEISCWNGSYDTNYVVAPTLLNSGAENSETNPYIIDSAAKLAYISKYYKASNVSGKYFKQTVDIDLCGYNWTTINTTVYMYYYFYEGNNHTIYNLYIYRKTSVPDFIGLFGNNSGGYIKNLTINGGCIEVFQFNKIYNTKHVGVFVGAASGNATISNCHNVGVDIKWKGVESDYDQVVDCGGIVGKGGSSSSDNGTSITNCSNSGRIYVQGGRGNDSYSSIGGIIGAVANKINITNCVNYGSVECQGWAVGIGGICGDCRFGVNNESSNLKVKYCENYGDIYGSTSQRSCYAGGIVGYLFLQTGYARSDEHISYCFNAGNVRGEEAVSKSPKIGGIGGGFYGSSADNSVKIMKCFSIGSVATLNGNSVTRLGGVIGGYEYTIITNCYYNYETVNQGPWTDNVSYLSNAADSQYLCGDGTQGTITNSWPRSTDTMKSSADGVAPSGINNISDNDSIYSLVAGDYPRIKSIPEENYSYNLNGSKSIVNTNSVQEISVWDGTSTAPSLLYSGAPNSEANPYIIDSAMKLAYISTNPSTFNGCYMKQTVDIDLDNRVWTPINSYTAVGVTIYYEGDNHTIYNLNINESNKSYIGFFAKLNGGYIKNLTLNGGCVSNTTTLSYSIVGAFVGEYNCNSGSGNNPDAILVLENCHNIGVTVSSNKTEGANNVWTGGLVGSGRGMITLKNCSNTGDVNSSSLVTSDGYAGGIIGFSDKYISTIENCVNYGNVTGVCINNGMCGGIVGSAAHSTNLVNCANYGTIFGTLLTGQTSGVGGIAGGYDTGSIVYCCNHGEIYAREVKDVTPPVGGIVGRFAGNSSVCVSYCYSTGSVGLVGATNLNWAGGVIGQVALSSGVSYLVSNCYYDYQKVNQGSWTATYLPATNTADLLFGTGNAANFVNCAPLTTAEMQGLTTSMEGFSSDIWEFSENDYPRLKSQGSLVSVWDGETATKPLGQGTEANPYIIASASDLRFLALNCNGSDYINKHYKQVVDIDLNKKQWRPIYMLEQAIWYDGNNHTIYNLYINNNDASSYNLSNSSTEYAGLFARIRRNSWIKNLTLQNGEIIVSDSGKFVQAAGICAEMLCLTDGMGIIENCHTIGVKISGVCSSAGTYRGGYAGGIAAHVYFGQIKNCSNTGSVEMFYINETTTGGVRAGGIAGYVEKKSLIENCVNYGDVYAKTKNSGGYAGGIAGQVSNDLDVVEKISNCANYGSILGCDDGATSGFSGGITGCTTTNVSIEYCFNAGQVIAEELTNNGPASGGITGGMSGGNSSLYPVLTKCVNIGAVGNHLASNVGGDGGIVGWNQNEYFSVSYCYYNYETIDKGVGDGNYYIEATNTASYLYGTNTYSSKYTNCFPLTTSQMIVTSSGTAPSGMSGFTTDNWEFYVGGYPQLKNMQSSVSVGISYWDGSSSEAPSKGDGSAGNPYQIASAANLAWLSDNSALGNSKYYLQTVDIDLCNHIWTPISVDESNQRRYYYDGGNHIIYNLNVNVVETEKGVYAGLFAAMHEFGYIKNLTLENGRVYGESTYSGGRVGAFIGSVVDNNTTIYLENLHNKNVTVIGKGVNDMAIGGIGGAIKSFQIKNCSNSGDVVSASGDGKSSVMGGITSYLWGGDGQIALIENCVNTGKIYNTDATAGIVVAGGIVGNSFTQNIEQIVRNCVNYGDIEIKNKNYWFIGGLCGSISKYSRVENCLNYGNITALDDEGTVSGAAHVAGGIVGRIGTDNDSVNITNCINYGEIYTRVNGTTTWSLYTGGIVGVAQIGRIKNCCNFGDVYSYYQTTCGGWHYAGGVIGSVGGSGLSFENCYNVASVMAGGKGCGLAGIVGQRSSTNSPYDTYINCYYNTDTIGSGTPKWEGTTQVPTGWAGCIVYTSTPLSNYADVTNCGGLTTAQMQSSANGTRPTGMVGFTQENWNFVKGAYPSLGLMAYEKIYSDNINAGTASVSVALGKNSGYSGVLSASYTINQATNVFTIIPTYANFTYLGTVSTPIAAARFGEVTYFFRDTAKTWNSNTISNTWNAGNYCIVFRVAATDNYTGLQTTLTFTINPIDITDNANLHINFDQTEYVYDGNAHTPTETVTYG